MSIKNIAWLIALVLIGCNNPTDKKQGQKSAETNSAEGKGGGFATISSAVFKIVTYDNNRFLEPSMGFFIAPDIAVTRLSFFESANKAVIEPFNESTQYEVKGFVGVDRINNLILLKIEGVQTTPIVLSDSILAVDQKTVYISKPTAGVVPLHPGTVISYSGVQGTRLYRVSNQLRSTNAGSPLFDSRQRCIGLAFMQIADYESQTFVTPSIFIAQLLKKAGTLQPLSELQTPSANASSLANRPVKGLVIETEMGNIRIKLSDKTPQYRDNFIKLARENYFDSLLIHRVIKGFAIQSGAADTRYAASDDVVGWKGPGYTLPAHFVPGMYHKRGAIGSPRKPESQNMRKRSDGSQFYIVTGRTYTDSELDALEKETDHQFTPEQRTTYKTIGGAPHLDATYTIFGEVVEGMEVADRISSLEVDIKYRPKKDIRIKKIRILE